MKNMNDNQISQLGNNTDDVAGSTQWDITIEDLSEKDIFCMNDKEDIVFFRSSSCCCTTC